MRIRRSVDADLPAILAVINEAAEAYRGVIPADRWHEPYMPQDHLEKEIADGVVFWIADEDGRVLGVIGVQDRGAVTLVRHAYVSTAAQRKGVGTTLLRHVENLTQKPILIGTWAAAAWAIDFYQRNGFRVVSDSDKDRLLRTYWSIPERQIQTSVVLADRRWRKGDAMAIVGLVGGLGPESTIDYYRRVLQEWQRHDRSSAPSIVIDSLDVQRGLHLVAHDRRGLTDYLLASIRRLAAAGVDFIAITANTPHIVFDELAAHSPVPLLSIVEVCAQEARRRSLNRLALLGTRFTMEASFYADVCGRDRISVVVPSEDDRAWIHERYVGELLEGVFKDETRQEFIALVQRLRAEQRIDGVILGGTELPLLLNSSTIAGVPALDTTALHVTAIVSRLRGD